MKVSRCCFNGFFVRLVERYGRYCRFYGPYLVAERIRITLYHQKPVADGNSNRP